MNYNLFDKLIGAAIIVIFCSVIGAVMYLTYKVFGLFGCIVYFIFVTTVFFWIAEDIRKITDDGNQQEK